jgi:hypothetical protein
MARKLRIPTGLQESCPGSRMYPGRNSHIGTGIDRFLHANPQFHITGRKAGTPRHFLGFVFTTTGILRTKKFLVLKSNPSKNRKRKKTTKHAFENSLDT